ncbi:MAG: hypothetical protein ETSY1_24365 [Candidatus Entotheonella factor]|uniref:Uncharacterized protein n=1 Tax=Entotheonella factor TaxID=1429438 RepID=W4LI53_ENTF1|nr:hypothetical protein [Candidatus Entotheonella palauensis]ETW97016.1 MAG: hypothetical protein ETSY1_24365 [Candidatus Entotheonella factor]
MLIQRKQGWLLVCLALFLGMTACSSTYRFQYRYTMIEPPGGSEGIEDDRVSIRLAPVPSRGTLNLVLRNQGTQGVAIDWEETHFIDTLGRRQLATEVGTNWFLRPANWFSDRVAIAPGEAYRVQVQAGRHQSYNPFSITRQASGAVNVSSSPRSLLPTSGNTAAIGQTYQGRTFQFILALRVGEEDIRYPFKFRITDVDVQEAR